MTPAKKKRIARGAAASGAARAAVARLFSGR
jgi:hypothetical protein